MGLLCVSVVVPLQNNRVFCCCAMSHDDDIGDDEAEIGVRDLKRLEAEHEKDGYRQGAAQGREVGMQNGFEDAFVEKFGEGFRSGFALGVAEARAQVALSDAALMRKTLFQTHQPLLPGDIADRYIDSSFRAKQEPDFVPVVAFRRQSDSSSSSSRTATKSPDKELRPSS